MPAPPPGLPRLRSAVQWRRANPRRAVAWWLCGGFAALLLGAWALPPLLDWGRFRTPIAAIAAARLGRPVVIGGDISLRLLPHAVLTAADVALPDQGDGLSGQVAALRLQVATLPLLTGRLVLRDLVLSAPVLRLPLRLPGGLPESISHSQHPILPHAFAARVENGVLHVGQTEITGITAAIHGGPEAASGLQDVLTSDGTPVAAFGAEGFAAAGGRTWRFTAALGAPNADGVAPVDVSVRGQGPVAETGGTIQGTLADGVIQGRLRAGGPDLSLLMPASALAWRAEAPFVASAAQVETSAIALSLGGAPADGALMLRLAAPARLEGRLHAVTLDLDGWAALLGRGLGLRGAPGGPALSGALPMRIAVSADTAALFGGTLQGLRATLASDGTQLGFDDAQATLPGAARVTAAHLRLAAAPNAAALALAGTTKLDAPDLHATLAWLRPLAPALVDALPAGVLRTASLTGAATVGAGGLAVSGLAGRIDDAAVTGSFTVQPGARPAAAATLVVDQLRLDGWLDGLTRHVASLPAFGRSLSAIDARLHVTAPHGAWHGLALENLTLDGQSSAAGLVIHQAELHLAGARLSAAGAVSLTGSLSGGRLAMEAPDLAPLLTLLPPAWRWAPGLWRGPGALHLAADGPPEALALQLRADNGDLVAEMEAVRDTMAATATATLTLRHPGAPRLAAALGLPGGLDAAIAWLDTGSLALRAHLALRPGHASIQDFDLGAARLRLGGQLEADWSGASPTLTGALAAEQLPLPPLATLWRLPAAASAWSTHIHLSAGAISAGNRTLANHLAADLTTASGDLLLDSLTGIAAGGRLSGAIALDLPTNAAAALTLAGARIDAPLTAWPVDIDQGSADLAADLSSHGQGWRTVRGTLNASLRDVRITGVDLSRAALSSGSSAGLTGDLAGNMEDGRISLSAAALGSADGSLTMTGGADAGAGTVDLRLVLPSGGNLKVTGPWTKVAVMQEAKGKPSFLKKRSKKLLH